MLQSVCQVYILHDPYHNIHGRSWSIPDFCWFLHHLLQRKLIWAFICFEKCLSWINDKFMWVAHEVFHVIYQSNESGFCWGIYVSTDTHGNILNITASLNSDVHNPTNTVIERYSTWFLIFQIFYNKGCIHKDYFFKVCVHWERWSMKIYLIFLIPPPQYHWIRFLMIWSVWSIIISY